MCWPDDYLHTRTEPLLCRPSSQALPRAAEWRRQAWGPGLRGGSASLEYVSSCPRGSLTCTGLRVPGDVCLGSRNGKYCFNLPRQSEPGAQLIAAKGWELAGPPSPPKLSFLLLLGRAGRGGGSRGQQSYVFRGDWLAPGADALGCPDVIGCWSPAPTPIFPSAEPEGWVSGGKGRRWARRPPQDQCPLQPGRPRLLKGLGCPGACSLRPKEGLRAARNSSVYCCVLSVTQ